MKRRVFIRKSGQAALGMSLLGMYGLTGCNSHQKNSKGGQQQQEQSTGNLFFKISLAQWSLHKALGRGGEATMDNLDFAAKAKNDYGIEAVEYVNQFFKDKAEDKKYLAEMVKRAEDNGVKNLLIMIDGEGDLGSLNEKERTTAVENHYKWVTAAKTLGCHSIRVNAAGKGSKDDVAKAAVDGLGRLATFAKGHDLNVIVENHGGYSSNGDWMAKVIDQVNMENVGMLPDFGNFCVEWSEGEDRKCLDMYDRYKGVKLFMKTAKAVSAKSHDFDADGNEIHTDFTKMLKIVKDAGYTGYIGIEYEGGKLSEDAGIRATKALLEKVGGALS